MEGASCCYLYIGKKGLGSTVRISGARSNVTRLGAFEASKSGHNDFLLSHREDA